MNVSGILKLFGHSPPPLKFMFKSYQDMLRVCPCKTSLDKSLIVNEQNTAFLHNNGHLKKIKTKKKSLCLNKCSMKYLFIIPSLSMKYNFYCWKPVDLSLAASEARQMLSWCRHFGMCMTIKYFSITCRDGFIQSLQCIPL